MLLTRDLLELTLLDHDPDEGSILCKPTGLSCDRARKSITSYRRRRRPRKEVHQSVSGVQYPCDGCNVQKSK